MFDFFYDFASTFLIVIALITFAPEIARVIYWLFNEE